MHVDIPISIGELCDRLSILRVKTSKIKDPNLVRVCQEEYVRLNELVPPLPKEARLYYEELYQVNGLLWDVEDKIRAALKDWKLDPEVDCRKSAIIGLSAKVIQYNGHRSQLKNQISTLFGSNIEIKNYRK